MKFTELESVMESKGIISLADIARALKTTPQAVSNWKARDQVPYHVEAKINHQAPFIDDAQLIYPNGNIGDGTISLSDILVTIAEQLKIILLVPFIFVFIVFTYEKYIKEPLYISQAVIILPDANKGSLGGFAGLASQFGMNIPTGAQADLSSPTLFPEIIKSRTFSEKILEKKFYSNLYNKELTLLALLTHGDEKPSFNREMLIHQANSALGGILKFDQDPLSPTLSFLTVTATDPSFAKNLADVVLVELESLNRFFKIRAVTEKISFIENRIASVQKELLVSEINLKAFNEQNLQISSPSLKLEEDRLMREVEVQKGVYLTLKQQLELAKIEEIQGASVIQILDKPQLPLFPSNIKVFLNTLLAGLLGIVVGLLLAFFRSYTNTSDKTERKKIRRFKNYFIKKGKSFLFDPRVTGFVSIMLLIGSPYYFSYRSQKPEFFGMYSSKIMILNSLYLFIFLISISLFIYSKKKKIKL